MLHSLLRAYAGLIRVPYFQGITVTNDSQQRLRPIIQIKAISFADMFSLWIIHDISLKPWLRHHSQSAVCNPADTDHCAGSVLNLV